MGRIKSTLVKRTAKLIMLKDSNFNDSFEHDKRLLGPTMPSKKIRNKIAGYMARLARMKKDNLAREKRKEAQIQVINQTPEYDMQAV